MTSDLPGLSVQPSKDGVAVNDIPDSLFDLFGPNVVVNERISQEDLIRVESRNSGLPRRNRESPFCCLAPWLYLLEEPF